MQANCNSTACEIFVMEFFASPVAAPSGFGEGQRFLGSTTVRTLADGNASFSVNLAVAVGPGEFITATATHTDVRGDQFFDTSEFSPALRATVLETGSIRGTEFYDLN